MDQSPNITTSAQKFERVFHEAAGKLGRSLEYIGLLNGQKDAPIPEQNSIVHIAATLLENGFAVYSEAELCKSKSSSKGRVDLIAASAQAVLVLEAKTFGSINLNSVLVDAQRVSAYIPQAAVRFDKRECAFWDSAEKWGGVVIQSYNARLNECWLGQENANFNNDIQFSRLNVREQQEFLELHIFLNEKNARYGRNLVSESKWENTDTLFLLWALFQL